MNHISHWGLRKIIKGQFLKSITMREKCNGIAMGLGNTGWSTPICSMAQQPTNLVIMSTFLTFFILNIGIFPGLLEGYRCPFIMFTYHYYLLQVSPDWGATDQPRKDHLTSKLSCMLFVGSEKRLRPFLKMWRWMFYTKPIILGFTEKGSLLPQLHLPSPWVGRITCCNIWWVHMGLGLSRNAPISYNASWPHKLTGIWGKTLAKKYPEWPSVSM